MSRKIDKLVAEHVMGLERYEIFPAGEQDLAWVEYVVPGQNRGIELPYYSTNIAAAWTIIEHLRKENPDTLMLIESLYGTNGCYCWINNHLLDFQLSGTAGDTAAEAICKAALTFKGVSIG